MITDSQGVIPQPSVTPEKKGYIFTGWYYKKNAKDTDRAVVFGATKVTANITLYARWISDKTTSAPTAGDGLLLV